MRRFAFYNAVILITVFLIVSIFYSSIGLTANNLSFSNRYLVGSLLPEGWGFFTRSARSQQLQLYKLDSLTEKLEVVNYKNSSLANWMGLSRRSRRIGLEFHRLLSRVPDSCWVMQVGNPEQVNFVAAPFANVNYQKLSNQLLYLRRGAYYVVSYEPIPWAWAPYPGHYRTPYKTVTIYLR